MINSVRRLTSGLFSSMSSLEPLPSASRRPASTPRVTRKSTAAYARARDSFWFTSGLPSADVWPTIRENVKHSRVLFYFNNAILLNLVNKTQESVTFFNNFTNIISYYGFFFVIFCQIQISDKSLLLVPHHHLYIRYIGQPMRNKAVVIDYRRDG